MQTNDFLLGVDLGGSKIEAAILDRGGRIIARQRRPTPDGDYQGILDATRDLCSDVEAEADAPASLPLGIGTPGSPSPRSGLMRNCNSTVLNGKDLRADLASVSGREVRIANDADCFALSEAIDGAGRGFASVFGVIIGTGVGGGVVLQQRVICGANRIAGEWGHNRMPIERVPGFPEKLKTQRPCYCGHSDCVETWLSGPGLALTHEQLHGSILSTGQLTSTVADAEHRQSLEIYTGLLAAALAGVVNLLDPDVIVLGGGLSNLPVLYQQVPELMKPQVFSDCFATPIRQALHGDSSGVRGAAWLWST